MKTPAKKKQPPSMRQNKLLQLLSDTTEGMTLSEIAKMLDVNIRTVSRDMAMLQKCGMSLTENLGSHGKKSWALLNPTGKTATFNYEEAAALYLGCRFLGPLSETFLGRSADDALKKIRAQLGQKNTQGLDKLLAIFHETRIGWSDYTGKSKMIETLIFACENRRETTIRYMSSTATEEETYTIHPYELFYKDGTLYVIGFSTKSHAVRMWKLNRVVEATSLRTKFSEPSFDIEEYRRKSFGVVAHEDSDVQKIRILFDGWVARNVAEHRWHASQKISKRKDGSVVLELELAPSWELVSWILKFGRHAEVLEPESLRERLRNETAEMWRRRCN